MHYSHLPVKDLPISFEPVLRSSEEYTPLGSLLESNRSRCVIVSQPLNSSTPMMFLVRVVVVLKKVLVVFDTKFGNTEKLAREIAIGIDETGLASSLVINIDEVEKQDLTTFDGVLFGAPIHAFRATSGIKRAVKSAAKMGLDGKLVGAFDTYQASGHVGKCAGQIENELRKKAEGAKLFSRHLTSLVDGYEGPLNDAEPAKARTFGQEFAKGLPV